jgi:hypothetical protein
MPTPYPSSASVPPPSDSRPVEKSLSRPSRARQLPPWEQPGVSSYRV